MSRVDHASDFATIYWHTRDRADLCTLTLLAWLSACDGSVAAEEEAFLRRIASAAKGAPVNVDVILEMARNATVDDLEIACRYALGHFSKKQRQLLAQLAITLAAKDGHITVGENYALQFLADLLNIKPRAFATMFEQITHRPYPEAGDPSSPDWWRRRRAGEEAHPAENLGPTDAEPAGPAPAQTNVMTRARALQLLGLNGDPTPDAVRSAFRRLAKARHPDRFAKLGPTAIAAATEAFQQLEAAHEYLKSAQPAGVA